MNMKKYLPLIIPAVTGIILYLINSNFLKAMFNLFPATLMLTFGDGAWWLVTPWYVKVLYVGIIAPILEELVFRHLLLGWFIKKKHFWIGLVISSIAFGFWHMVSGWGILKAVDMIFVGMVFALIYRRYGIKGSIIAHLANNWLSLLFLLVL
jgi:membrane protease YdiL (CAAX protease family)